MIVVFEGIDQKYLPKVSKADSIEIEWMKKTVITDMRRDGFWLASLDSVRYSEDTLTIFGYQGKSFDVIEVSITDNKSGLNSLSRFPKIKSHQISSPDQIEAEIEELLDYLDASGYPFASFTVDSTHLLGNQLHVYLQMDLGSRIIYDSLQVSPSGLVKPSFLSKYLRLDYGKNYDERDLEEVKARIQHLPFLSLVDMHTSFQLKKAKVTLELEPRKVNYFDGILGLVPGRDGEGVEVTGELDLSINNLFQSGKKIDINWTKLEPGSQQLHASYLHPILLGSPLDLYFALDQIRQDTIYSNRSLKLAFDYRPTRQVSMRISYESLLGNELDNQSGASGDFDIDYYGLAVTWYQLDQLYNPKEGFKIDWNGNIGRKSVINSNAPIPESTQYRLQFTLEAYKRISPRSVIYLASQNGLIFNDYLYLNDLFRLGGLQTVRGFNELEFFASKYALVNLEWRYYLDANSYLVAFYDQSFLAYEILGGDYSDNPAGLGAGMQFMTERGNFKILYGLGKRDGESFSFANSKIHFGYTAIF
ncbi:BamA/TamA family outer membrane protein [Reichenbachiella sp.]|uniref:BamA/TamA family outer membrane protein n=1 Tax=Reichenbachiella sp. TaxID=2184521 RepID=UPI003BB09BD2